MKAKLLEPYKLLSGRLENVVNFPIEKRPMVRDMVIPYNPKTVIQEQIRAYFAQASAAFNTISDAQRILWHNYAQKIFRTNSLGQTYSIPDKSLFVQVNLYRQFNDEAITLNCPTQESIGTITNIRDFQVDDPYFVFTVDYTGDITQFLIECSNALPGLQRQARKNELLLISTAMIQNIEFSNGSGGQIGVFLNTCKFEKNVGDRICIKLTPLNSGYVAGMTFNKAGIIGAPPVTTSKITGLLSSNEPNYASMGGYIEIWNSDNTVLMDTIYPENGATTWESILLPAGDYNIITIKGLYESTSPDTYDNVTLIPPTDTTDIDFYFEDVP